MLAGRERVERRERKVEGQRLDGRAADSGIGEPKGSRNPRAACLGLWDVRQCGEVGRVEIRSLPSGTQRALEPITSEKRVIVSILVTARRNTGELLMRHTSREQGAFLIPRG